MAETGEILEGIKAGDHDGSLVDIIEAVRVRLTFGTTAIRWKVTFEDVEYREEDLTLGEASTVERLTGSSWGQLNPESSATECQAIVAACIHHRTGAKLGDAVKKVGEWTAADAAQAIGSYEVDEAPKD